MSPEEKPPGSARLLTCAEAGELLSLRERQVREAIRRGHLPSVKIGRHVRLPLQALEKLIEERQIVPAEPSDKTTSRSAKPKPAKSKGKFP